METHADPFRAEPPAEVPLPNAPLVRVIGQVRFPIVLSVNESGFIAPFQEAIRGRYPVLRPEQLQGFVVGPTGPQQVAPQALWRFHDGGGEWRVSLAPDFVALETTAYRSRADFLERLGEVLQALAITIHPGTVDRVGVRYVDRITGDALEELATLVNPHVLGVTGTPLDRHAESSVAENVFAIGSDGFVARWGRLPPGATIDPGVLGSVQEPSWILDLDMFSKEPREFRVEDVLGEAQRYAERIYTFFRWAVTDDFLRRFGGQP
ncbi:TIGR04255 family protein [Vulgatibacter sp.]|uniref:TIGR04255 family protein n=1 Tax=Vulgatibacter sp. TaxID=1971226 RepID=UPI00356AB10D